MSIIYITSTLSPIALSMCICQIRLILPSVVVSIPLSSYPSAHAACLLKFSSLASVIHLHCDTRCPLCLFIFGFGFSAFIAFHAFPVCAILVEGKEYFIGGNIEEHNW